MKKIIVCLLVICIVLFSGCSCNDLPLLEFDTLWLTPDSTATKTYTVKMNTAYNDGTVDFTYTNSAMETYGEIDITGSYVVSYSICKNNADVESKISKEFRNLLVGDNIFVYETELNLNVKYAKQSDKVHQDYIKTKTYFFGQKLMPLYSITESSVSYLGYENDKLQLTKLKGMDETIYDIDSYKINRSYSLNDGEPEKQTAEYDYDKGTVIDNTTLLFALENYNVEKGSAKSIEVVSPSYEKSKSLSISCYEIKDDVKIESFVLTPETSGCFGGDTGRSQIVFLSKTDKSYEMVKYISPLTSYDGSYILLGALQYELEK